MIDKYGGLIILLLVVVIGAGSLVAWSRYTPGQPIEIAQPSGPEIHSDIYVVGAVNNPGLYPLKVGDSVENIIKAAGGTTASSDINQLKLYIPESAKTQSPQKIDINRAEAWLLEALPGIGKARAEAIVSYRRQNGPFHNITELTKIDGISTATYEQLKDLITVAE